MTDVPTESQTPPEETVLTAPVQAPGPEPDPARPPDAVPEPDAVLEPDAEPVPEEIAYADFTVPDGVTLDAPALAEATALFRQARLPQEQAQKFVDLALSREKLATERSARAFADLQAGWVASIKADPEIGGPKFAASIAQAGRACSREGRAPRFNSQRAKHLSFGALAMRTS